MSGNMTKLTPPAGMRFYFPPEDAVLTARDGRVEIPYGGLPIPLLEEDAEALQGEAPSYDAVGRGIYQALRKNQECAHAAEYAEILRDGYPHVISELGAQVLMLDHKEVDLPYLDRKIAALRIFSLLEPENFRLKLETALTFQEKAMLYSAPGVVTRSFYRAEEFLRKALQLAPQEKEVMLHLGEVSFILGRYEDAACYWRAGLDLLPGEKRGMVTRRLEAVGTGELPLVPPVDYMEAVRMALQAFEQGDAEEAAAMLRDVLDDAALAALFPLPEAHYVLGCCYEAMAMPRYAEESYEAALLHEPRMDKAREALERLR